MAKCVKCDKEFGIETGKHIAHGKCCGCYHREYKVRNSFKTTTPKIKSDATECISCGMTFDELNKPQKNKCKRCYSRDKYRNSEHFKNKWTKSIQVSGHPYEVNNISTSQYIEIESFLEQIKKSHYMLELEDIFKIVDLWQIIYENSQRYDQFSPGKQIQLMYKDLKGIQKNKI